MMAPTRHKSHQRGAPGSKTPALIPMYHNPEPCARPTKIWSAVAERSDDTAFATTGANRKRRGAALPAAVQKVEIAAPAALGLFVANTSAALP
jgi:hypothetical protein